jgi:hypothetical protein
MSFELLRRAQQQEPASDGLRRTRYAVIRNTYGELKDTALKTWLYWFDEDYFGEFNYGTMTHKIRLPGIAMDVLFRALDRPKDVKKTLSLELSGVWVNEAREIPKGIIDGLKDAVGRFPPERDGGCTHPFVAMDTNSMDEDHWWYKLAEEDKPEGWRFFNQPGGLMRDGERFIPNPKAENIQNLKGGYDYYLRGMQGQKRDHVLIYYCNEYGFVQEGKPVHPEYIDSVHCSNENLEPVPNQPIVVGIDFGLTPAALFSQRLANGRWLWIDELVTEDMGTSRFADILGPKLRGEYRNFDLQIWGDPAGDDRAQTDETTPFQILNAKGIPARPAPSNDPVLRCEAVSVPLMRMIDGQPGMVVSPKCKVARKGLAGGYCYKRVQVANEERYHDKPVKNRYSHVVEAGQYAMLGAGEGQMLITIPRKPYPKQRKRVEVGGLPTAWMGV